MPELRMSTFCLPDLGEGLQEAEIVAWHVAPGDHVVAKQPMISVETANAMVKITSPQSGRIKHVHGAPGDIIGIGKPLAEFDPDGTDGSDPITMRVRFLNHEVGLPANRFARTGLGCLLIAGGLLGFLPVLGFWMVPLGLLVLSVDFAWVRRRRRRMEVWFKRRWQNHS